MPLRKSPKGTEYYLLHLDKTGAEVLEEDVKLSDELISRLSREKSAFTDIFVISHGWKGDVDAAIEQYDRWIDVMDADLVRPAVASLGEGAFKPLVVGVHWPSLPFGNETVAPAGPTQELLSDRNDEARAEADVEYLTDKYAAVIADTPKARAAIRTILKAAQKVDNSDQGEDGAWPPALVDAYRDLYAAADTASAADGTASPTEEKPPPPLEITREPAVQSGVLGGKPSRLSGLRDALLVPLRQLSFRRMKDRARLIGEGGAHTILGRLQRAAPEARYHLMGHSFGCIVVSGMVAGPSEDRTVGQVAEGRSTTPGGAVTGSIPVQSLFLVQGAMSLWAFASDIKPAPGTLGHFHKILRDNLVRGPIVTTRSTADTAVTFFYPVAVTILRQFTLADESELPKYGALGTFGIRGVDDKVVDLAMEAGMKDFEFEAGKIYNFDADGVIKAQEGLSGAHNDIAHPELARAFLAAALSDRSPPQPRWLTLRCDASASGGYYQLAISIESVANASGLASVPLTGILPIPTANDEISVKAELQSTGAEIYTRERQLRLSPDRVSLNKAVYNVHQGEEATYTVTLSKDGRVLHSVEAVFKPRTMGSG